MTAEQPATEDHAPLIGKRFLYSVTAVAITLAALTSLISLAGQWYGGSLALAGHTENTDINDIIIGQDHLRLASNTIRFADQRATGATERVDLYATWPEMQGYSDATRHSFNDINRSDALIFMQISQSTMSRDMSGRVDPIYKHLFEGAPSPGPSGLVKHHMRETSGYGHETLLTADRGQDTPYAVRCLLPQTPDGATSADCQRDIHIGTDLVVLYRFSSQLLPQWQAIDKAVIKFINERLAP
ncbi:hypothetical protein QO002_002199 [Pararhizobium capsulatum DSM 1112]|uniref:Transmembrane anchored protein n=1 Tax=Pararhizobium capsulatum DSM 1112 TaxID=1121113 RepID=A0ABU0BQV1_9HYPH|nr:hypothetical protein [Pararhizobium capsulatum]MDQ0320061.1 hypothetical protein [Pararhizobium capsulatum DSM 1112]